MEIVKELFNTTDLYSILDITADKAADSKALKAAYLKAALKIHPDKGAPEERELRTKKFQVVKQIYELLQDDDMRKSYEETGDWPDNEEFSLETASFGRLDEQTILDFKRTYLGSEEEIDDVKKLYKEGNGNILHVLDNLFFANILDDEERVQAIIDDLIETGQMEKLGTGVPNKKAKERQIRKAKKEAKEAEEARKEMNMDGSLDSLRQALAKSSAKRGSFLDDLEKKYGSEKNGKSKTAGGRGKGKKAKEDPNASPPKSNKRKSDEPSNSGRSTRARAK